MKNKEWFVLESNFVQVSKNEVMHKKDFIDHRWNMYMRSLSTNTNLIKINPINKAENLFKISRGTYLIW